MPNEIMKLGLLAELFPAIKLSILGGTVFPLCTELREALKSTKQPTSFQFLKFVTQFF